MHHIEDTLKEVKSIRRYLEATFMVLVMAIVAPHIEAIQLVAGAHLHRRHPWKGIPSVGAKRNAMPLIVSMQRQTEGMVILIQRQHHLEVMMQLPPG